MSGSAKSESDCAYLCLAGRRTEDECGRLSAGCRAVHAPHEVARRVAHQPSYDRYASAKTIEQVDPIPGSPSAGEDVEPNEVGGHASCRFAHAIYQRPSEDGHILVGTAIVGPG